ncbi:unnamed protein product, partial [Symbiodinium pilosum]
DGKGCKWRMLAQRTEPGSLPCELGHHLRLFDWCFWAHQQQPQCQVPYPPHAIRLRLLDLGAHLHLGGGVRCGADVPIVSRQPNRYDYYSLVDWRMHFPVRMDSLLRAGGHDWGNGLHVGHLHLPHGRHFAPRFPGKDLHLRLLAAQGAILAALRLDCCGHFFEPGQSWF